MLAGVMGSFLSGWLSEYCILSCDGNGREIFEQIVLVFSLDWMFV